MPTTVDTPHRARPSRPRRAHRVVRSTIRSLIYCAALLPVALVALPAGLLGQGRSVAGWWDVLHTRLLGAHGADPTRRPGPVAVVNHALLSLLLGTAALVPLGAILLIVARGALYGFVEPGPFDNSWGGPTLAGAWLAHFLIGIPFALAGLAALAGIAAVHHRLTLALHGARRAPWLVPATALVALFGALVIFAWSRQL
ncbi:hypothetical protein [Micromonospora rubida]|uniref:hypothetical protein n=1 Tax=Micromonospora rubida TaxID=2697657 RepID=UPI001377FFC9|nr:hypothetical protein [Micromonospora rubida]NBE81105.1 hypothetical protein [Micromonospora rubida]